ncbi:MAG TPA: nitroreductase/quinone reductase family protein [Myxococcota bacterium]|nr:nitroreductase/quinone reductase family protein [Myxococcota bacterium]
MRAMKIAVVVVLVYMGIVTLFESSIGYLQPTPGNTLVITTFDKAGVSHDRVVSRLESDGKLYVAANHWPRAWYRRALANPDVEITMNGTKGTYRAVPVSGDEHTRVESANRLPFFFRVLTGFPPRLFMRLDPR